MKRIKIKKGKVSVMLTALLLLLVIYFVATLVGVRGDIKSQAAQNKKLTSEIEAQSAANEELEAIINSEDKDAYIERRAREEYGYAAPAERVYYDTNS